METSQNSSVFLVNILEELDTKQNTVSYQDLCKSLCARFDLSQLAKLRSVLFYTACLDPNFPATLFKDKMRCTVNNQQSKKIMVAADIVTIFNLIQMNGGMAKEKLPVAREKVRKKESVEACPSDPEVCDMVDCVLNCELRDGEFSQGYSNLRPPKCRKVDCKDCPQFVPASEPNFLLGVNKEIKGRAASLDRLQALASYTIASSPPCEMQSTYFPMNIETESISDQDSLPISASIKETFISNDEPFIMQSCVQKRNIFKEDFHNLITITPNLISPNGKPDDDLVEPPSRKETSKQSFFNHSFEMPYSSQYLNPIYSPVPEAFCTLCLHGDAQSGNVKGETEPIFLFNFTFYPLMEETFALKVEYPPDNLADLPWDQRCDIFLKDNLQRLSTISQQMPECWSQLQEYAAAVTRGSPEEGPAPQESRVVEDPSPSGLG